MFLPKEAPSRGDNNTILMKRLSTLVPIAAALLFFVGITARAEDKKADPTGTWTWSMPGRNGGPDREQTLKLKAEGDKLTGTMSSPARGGESRETKIEHGKVTGDEVSFDVTREFNGNSFTSKYKGKVSGDTITGKISTERDGQTRDRDWTAKRKAEAKKETK
jgi:hypothetical protein